VLDLGRLKPLAKAQKHQPAHHNGGPGTRRFDAADSCPRARLRSGPIRNARNLTDRAEIESRWHLQAEVGPGDLPCTFAPPLSRAHRLWCNRLAATRKAPAHVLNAGGGP